MSEREERHIVQVLVMDRYCRSGNCPDIYATKKEAERAIAQKGIGYMAYRVKKVCKRRSNKVARRGQ